MGLFSGLFDLGSSGISAGANIEIANKQMAFQERMSNTQYQRTMADMRKAGLNPILAAKLGGAGTPPGAAIPVNLSTKAATTARQTSKLEAETKYKQFEMELLAEQISSAAGQARTHWLTGDLLSQQLPLAKLDSDFFRSPGGKTYRDAERIINMGATSAKALGDLYPKIRLGK